MISSNQFLISNKISQLALLFVGMSLLFHQSGSAQEKVSAETSSPENSSQENSSQKRWDATAYQVKAVLFSDGSPIAKTQLSTLPAQIKQRVVDFIGKPWNFEVELSDTPFNAQLFEKAHGWKSTQASKIALDSSTQKTILVCLSSTDGSLQIQSQEWDATYNLWGPPISKVNVSPQNISNAVFDCLWNAFSPVGRITKIKEDQILLQPQGATLGLRDSQLNFFQVGDAFRLIRNDSSASQSFRELEWTYAVIETAEPALITAKVVSRFTNALEILKRNPRSWKVIGMASPKQSTQLQFVGKSDQTIPIHGLEILSNSFDGNRVTSLGRTNSLGKIFIPASEGSLQLLTVRIGGEFLTQLPLVSGAQKNLTIQLTAEEERVALEAIVQSLRTELVEMVAENEVSLARAIAKAQKNEPLGAESFLSKVKSNLEQQQKLFSENIQHWKSQPILSDATAKASLSTQLDPLAKYLSTHTTERLDKITTDVSAILAKKKQPAITDSTATDSTSTDTPATDSTSPDSSATEPAADDPTSTEGDSTPELTPPKF